MRRIFSSLAGWATCHLLTVRLAREGVVPTPLSAIETKGSTDYGIPYCGLLEHTMSSMTPVEEAESLQNLLVAHATGGVADNDQYVELRQRLLGQVHLEDVTPSFVRTCRDLSQFWQHIKFKFAKYAERRAYIWNEFRPLLDKLEGVGSWPADQLVTSALTKFDSAHVHEAWAKALERRASDPEGAITISRTLLESVCKHILEEAGVVADHRTPVGAGAPFVPLND